MRELEGLSPAALGEVLGGTGRARQVWRALAAGLDPAECTAISESTRRVLRESARPAVLTERKRDVASCGTTKLRFGLADDQRIETVVIPSQRRSTVCVSTQAGCARGCVFCVTATMGLERNLTASEIVGQVVAAIRLANREDYPPVTNVVYMGMGEPLDNLAPVRASIEILIAPEALGLGPSHVTLSTVGPSPGAILDTASIPVRLAWSLHAVDDDLRRRLVPTARHSTRELRDAFAERLEGTGQGLFVEMTLIEGVNDAECHADALVDFLAPLPPSRVNLLPMNGGRPGLSPTPKARAVAFRDRVRSGGLWCALRRARGAERSAACGQLAVV